MPPPGGQLLHCNLERTLLVACDPSTDRREVHKLLVRGSLVDAELECAIGQRLAHLDVVRYLGAQTHAATGMPCVRTAFAEGTSLDALVATRGAVPAATACALLLPVARTLAAMHAMRAPDLPHGLCHGDVKPSNLIATGTTTLLLDFEHAGPSHQGASRGSPSFAGPEAADGAPLTPAFDVYGLGATLHWLLAATPPRRGALAAQDPELQLLIESCLVAAPSARPTAELVAQALTELSQRLADDPLEAARSALLAGRLDVCERTLGDGTGPAHAGLRRELQRRRRLLARRPELLLATDPIAEGDPTRMARDLARLASVARRFPAHAATVDAIAAHRRSAARLLAERLPGIFDLVRSEQFELAHSQLHDLQRLTAIALELPGPFRVPGETAAHMPSLLQRAPLACLQQEEQRLCTAEAEHREVLERLHAAEAAFALDEAHAVIESIGSRYGGTSSAVAQHRDRLHRLGFYLERITRARDNIDRLFDLLPGTDPAPLRRLVDECSAAMARSAAAASSSGGSIGLRSLHLALNNLRDEFEAVRPRAESAAGCLDRALGTITDEGWQLVADAQQKLQQEPIPVRPLQLLLGRLDTFRTLEAFVDRPQRPRSALIDRIEGLRMRLEQAQATRDRLARGAEQALAKGHWTTGLFDMERAVTHLQTEDDLDDRQAALLRQRLADARKRKQEIESAQRRNHELTNRYAALQDEADSTTTDRLLVLREQRDCLQFLAVHAQKDRGSLYARDLRDVELRIAQEQASQAEVEMDVAESPGERLRIAAQALAQLETFASTVDAGVELPGRLRRLIDHWRRQLGNEQRAQQLRFVERQARRRRRVLAALAAGVMITLAAIGVRSLSTPASAASIDPLLLDARELPQGLVAPALELIAELAPTRSTPVEAAATLADGERAVRAFLLATTSTANTPQRGTFGAAAWARVVATARAAGEQADFEDRVAAAAERLHADGLPR